MNKNIKNVKFTEIDSSLKGAKEFIVTYDCNGKLVKEVFFVEEKAGLKNSDYLKLAKEKFKPNPKATKGGLKTSPLSLKIIAACAGVAAVTLGGLFTWKMLTNNPITPEPEPEPVVQEYTVKWVDEDGSLMDEEIYKEGEIPAYKGEYHDKAGIFKDDGEEYMHFQEGWEEDINTPITEDTTFHAVYSDRLLVTKMVAEITQDDLDYFEQAIGVSAVPIGFALTGTYNHIDWDDGESGEADKYKTTHSYTAPGTYNIKMYGNIQNIYTEPDPGYPRPEESCDGDYCITNIEPACSYNGKNKGGIILIEEWLSGHYSNLKSWTVPSSVTDLSLFIPETQTPLEIKFEKNSRCRYIRQIRGINAETITIPNSVLEIALDTEGTYGAFYENEYIKEIKFEENSRCHSFSHSSFEGCTALEKIELPESLTDIEHRAFYNCTNLTSVSFPTNIKNIGNEAFCECTNLQEVLFDVNSVNVHIQENVFKNCSQLNKVVLPIDFTLTGGVYESPFFHATIKDIVIPEGTKTIRDNLFYATTFLNPIKIPDSVSEIGNDAFGSATISSIDLSNVEVIGKYALEDIHELKTLTIPSTLTKLEEGAIRGCEQLETVVFPDDCKLKALPDELFYAATSLKNVNLPRSIEKLGERAFQATVIESMDFRNNPGITVIPDSCFNGCADLTSVEFNNNLTYIGETAFYGTALTSIKLPNTLTYIGSEAFQANSLIEVDLTDFTNPNPLSLPFISESTFWWYNEGFEIKVASEEMKTAFTSAPGWNTIESSKFVVA